MLYWFTKCYISCSPAVLKWILHASFLAIQCFQRAFDCVKLSGRNQLTGKRNDADMIISWLLGMCCFISIAHEVVHELFIRKPNRKMLSAKGRKWRELHQLHLNSSMHFPDHLAEQNGTFFGLGTMPHKIISTKAHHNFSIQNEKIHFMIANYKISTLVRHFHFALYFHVIQDQIYR